MTATKRRTVRDASLGAALGLLGLALGACHSGEGGSGAGGARSGIPACRPDDLALKLLAQSADTRVTTYRFENRSHAVCVLKSRPDVTLQGPDGKPLTASIETDDPMARLGERGLKVRPSKVVLRPGRRAAFSVVLPAQAPGQTCRPFVRITAIPPGGDWGLDAAQSGRLCGNRLIVSSFTYDGSDD